MCLCRVRRESRGTAGVKHHPTALDIICSQRTDGQGYHLIRVTTYVVGGTAALGANIELTRDGNRIATLHSGPEHVDVELVVNADGGGMVEVRAIGTDGAGDYFAALIMTPLLPPDEGP